MFLDMRTVRAAFRAEGIQVTFIEVDFNPPKTLH
jgi:hypothetical protein